MIGTSEVYVPTPKDYLDIFFRRKWPYLVGLFLGACLVVLLQTQQLMTFESEALVEVKERDRGSSFVAGLSKTSSFMMRWNPIQHRIFNKNVIARHTRLFAGIDSFQNDIEGSLEEDIIKDGVRYTTKYRVPYDEKHDREVWLTPYQWWLVRHELDMLGLVPPVAEGASARQRNSRMRVAHWFYRHVFGPMEEMDGDSPRNRHWPVVNGRQVPGRVVQGTGLDARLGEKIPVNVPMTDDDIAFKLKEAPEGEFTDSIDISWLRDTTLTDSDLELLTSRGFVQEIETGVSRGPLPSGFKVHFSSNNPRLTRFVVAWTIEMIIRFSEHHQYEEIFGSRKILKTQLARSNAKLIEVQRRVSRFLEDNVEKYEDSMARYLLDPQAYEAPRVGKDNQVPESAVRRAYNKVTVDLEDTRLRLLEIEAEVKTVSKQLANEPETIRRNITRANPEYARIESQLNDFVAERKEMLYTKTMLHPHVAEVTRKIDALQDVLSRIERNVLSESTTEENPRRVELKARLDELQGELSRRTRSLEALEEQGRVLREDLKKVPAIEQEIFNLKNELQGYRSTVRSLRTRISEAQQEEDLAYNLARTEFKLKVMPTPPDMPKDKLFIHIGMGFVLCLVASILIIVFSEFFDPSIKEISDVNRYLDASVIGVIPKIPVQAFKDQSEDYSPENTKRRRGRRRSWFGRKKD